MSFENTLEYIFSGINKNTNINLSFVKQCPIKNHLERQVGYICEERVSKKKYWLTVAYSKAQQYRLKRTYHNLQKDEFWKKFFKVNLPITHGMVNNCYYILYEYIEEDSRCKVDKRDELGDILSTIEQKYSFEIEMNEKAVEDIMRSIIEERCPDDDKSREYFQNSVFYKKCREVLANNDKLRLVNTHCDFKPRNIILSNNEKYLLGFEFGGINLPIGFDQYNLNSVPPSKIDNNLPYLDFYKNFENLHHVDSCEKWLRFHNPIVKYCKGKKCIKVLECGKFSTIEIKPLYLHSNYSFSLDFRNVEISPYATLKIVNMLKKMYGSDYTIKFEHCPYFFEGLSQDCENLLSFSGIINKTVNIKFSLKNFKNSQAYLCYSKILPYVKPYWFRAILAMLICIPIGSLDAVIALSLKPYMDLVMVEKTIQSSWYIPFVIVAFTTFQGILNYLATYLNTWVGGKITKDLKLDLYKKFLTFETSYFDRKKSGDIVYRFNTDADTACNGLLENMKVFLSRLFSSISLVGVLFYNSWQLAIIASVILGCAFAPIANLRKRVKSVMDQSVTAGSAVITAYNESFAGNKTIISYNLEERQKSNMKNILNNIFNLKIKMIQKTSWLSPLMHVIVSVGIGVAIGYGSHLILTKQITSGNFVSFITALILLYTPIKNLGNNFNSVQFSFMAIERIFSILESSPQIISRENAINLVSIDSNIKFENVFFEYIKNRPVLKGINLVVNKGETIAFVGNSGGGKTTIVSLIPRFYDITSGSISIDGIDLRDYTLESLRKNIAVVFQDNFLFSGTIRENILLGNENASSEQLQKAIDMAFLSDFISNLKDGLDTQIGERGIRLSGGQKQRVAIARAFLKDAPIVILDEATSALDNKSEAIVQKAIENLMQDKTVFVIAHRLSTIKNADRIVVINEGQIVESGSHEELLSLENGVYKLLYGMQFKNQEVT